MRPMVVKVGSEIEQLVFEICRSPKQNVIQILPSLPGAIYHQELVFEQKGLGNEGTDAAMLEQLGQDGD
jgi:hypothetical protein